MAPTLVNNPPTPIPPVICDFGWYYGTVGAPQRASEYTVMNPPGYTTLSSSVTFPTASPVQVASTASFEQSGTLTFYAGLLPSQRTTVQYAITDGTHFSCTGGSGTFGVGTPVYDPRMYVDSLPLKQNVVFDAVDANNLGLPIVATPTGINIVSYQWDLGNGVQGTGPFTSTTYTYSHSLSVMVRLIVTDSLRRVYSCAHTVVLTSLTPLYAYDLRESTGRISTSPGA